MLLLVAMPTVGRQFGSGFALPSERLGAAHAPAAGSMPGMARAEHGLHLAGMAGAGHAHHRPHMAVPTPDGPGEAPAPHDGHARHDCAYCPLLSSLTSASVPRLLLGPAPLAPWSVRVAAAPPLAPPVPALGSQGPPR